MRARIPLAIIALLALITALLPLATTADEDEPIPPPPPTVLPTRPAATPTFTAPSDPAGAFGATWDRTDSAQVRGERPYLWGPRPIIPIVTEPLAGAPGNRRPVLYWDKGRMEVNDRAARPDRWYVTNGLLVSEMVAGRQQVGVNPDRYAARAPAAIPFGDLDDPAGPTFASFAARLADPPLATGAPVAQALDRAGTVSAADAGGVTCATVAPETKHCIAAPFWAFLNATGPIVENRRVTEGRLFDPAFYATGLPISEAYWITVKAGGKPARVLIQLFERRTLTYNPANGPEARVEMGNVGLQYYRWRYDALLPGDPPTGLDPAMRAGIDAVWAAGPQYRYLPRNLAGGRFQLLFQDLASVGAYGAASGQLRLIVIDDGFAALDPRSLGGVLAHESQHAYDFATVGEPVTVNECVAFELRAFLVGSAVWQSWYGPNGKPNPANAFELRENAMLLEFRANPERFARDLSRFYTQQCGRLGPGAPDRFLTLEGLPEGIERALPVERAFAALRSPGLLQQPLPDARLGAYEAVDPARIAWLNDTLPPAVRDSRRFMTP